MAFNFDVVISGISGRFPECDDVDTFKKKLYTGDSKDFVTVDERRWKNGYKLHRYHDKYPIPQATGKFKRENDFDFRVFKFNQIMARSTFALNRKCLEVSFEAIIDAGINPSSLSGANIGVFMPYGIAEKDLHSTDSFDGYVFVLGCSRPMGPNRLSYALNLTGPSFASVCDPLGSIEMLRLAKTLIQDGSIEGALVVASNQITHPQYSYLYEYLNLLTPETFCRSFDQNANGYVRSESSVALFLQREQDAKRIYAKVKFCDRLYEGLLPHTVLGYDEEYLRNSLLKIYERNGGDAIAKDLAFLELNGNAVKKFETIEANAVADVLFKWRKNALPVGSIKSLVGHTEAASPFVSILKIIFALDSNIIAPNKNFSQPNENIRAFREQKFKVVTKKTELSGNLAAVNVTGLFGAVNHIVLEKNLKEATDDAPNEDSLPRLLLLSGRTVDGLRNVLTKICFDSYNIDVIAMTNDVFSTNIPQHIFRGYTILTKTKSMGTIIEEREGEKRPICFVFSGMGSQWNGMGKQLLNLPVFADAIKRCDAVLRPKSINIYDIILSDDPNLFDNITMSFVGIICMQIALVEVLKKLNIHPDIILGHSVGENGCAYADGCVTLEQAVLISLARGTASNTTKLIKGMMAAIGKGYKEIKDSLPKSIEVACHNSATSCTISGPAEDVNIYVEKLKKQGTFARAVNVSNIAYHSRYIAPAGPKLLELLQPVVPNPKIRSSKWISSSVPKEHWSSPLARSCSAEYFTNNLLNPVLFEEACKHIPKNAVIIEIAPHGLLQAILRRAMPDSCTNISLTHRSANQENLKTLLASIGRLYIAGCEPVVNNLYPPIEYPVPRGTPSISPYCTWFYGDCDTVEPYQQQNYSVPLSSEKIIVRINENSEFSFLKFHRIDGEAVIPPSFFLYLVWHMLSINKNVAMDDFPVLFEKVTVRRNVKISISKPQIINILIQGSGFFEVLSRTMFNTKKSKVVLTGRVEFIEDDAEIRTNNFTLDTKMFEFTQDALDKILRNAGFQLGKCFQLLKNLNFEDTESNAKIQWNGNWVALLDAALKFQMFSDICKSKLCYLHSVRRILITPSIIGSMSHGSTICCNYNKLSKEFQCNGIEMNDVKWKIKQPKCFEKSTSSSNLRKLRFVSYENPSCQTFDEFLELCLQIATEDFQTTTEANLNLNICDNTEQFISSLQNSNCIRNLKQFKVSYIDLVTFSSKKISGNEKFILITEDDQHLNSLHTSDLFVLLVASKQNSSVKIPSKFSVILSQCFSEKMFYLVKKNPSSLPEVTMEENNIDQNQANGMNSVKNEVIVRSKLDSSNLSLMLSRKNRSNSRYLFVSGTKESLNSNKSQIISKAICNLPVSVLKDQDWGSYRYLPTTKISSIKEISANQRFCNIQIESINAEYIRCEASEAESDDSQSNSELKLVGVEYSGWNEAGEKIMGLTSTCPSYPISKVDPILRWKVPNEWKLAEAVTVPAVYSHVYSIMKIFESSLYYPNISIVITTDSKNAFAKSLISFCVAKFLTLHCVVPDEENAKDLKLEIPALNESNVIVNTNNDFDLIILLKTKGRGANCFVNYLPGFRNIILSMNCTTSFPIVIETVRKNMDEDNELGLLPFAFSCSFFVRPCNITHLLSLPVDQKIYLQNAIKTGIERGFVKPLLQKHNNTSVEKYVNGCIDEPSNECNSKSQVLPNTELKSSSQSLKFVANQSYIIMVGGRISDVWMKIIQWLRERNASNFVVVVDKFSPNPRTSSQINTLLRNKKITISFKSSNTLNSLDDATRLIDETNKLAPLDSVFFVSMESSSRMINYMDNAAKACQKKVKFISLFAGGVEEMEARQSRGQPSFVLHGERFPNNLPEVLTEFEKMLTTFNPFDTHCCLYEILENSNNSDDLDQLTSLRLVLPKSIHNLERIGRNIAEEIKFVEMASRCVRLADSRGVYPIFVIPGLHAFELQSFYQSLMYPVFCASLPENSSSIPNTASKLHEHLNHIQKTGPVTIIGETWNAAIAIELSSLVKKSGRDFKVFILEGNPKEWKNIINTLNLTESQQFEKILLKIYGDQIKKYLYPWNPVEAKDKLCHISEVPNGNQKINSAHIRRCLKMLKQQFINIHKYNLKNSMIENTVFFSRQVLDDISLVLSDSSDVICVPENDYDTLIRSPVVRKIINKHAMFAW